MKIDIKRKLDENVKYKELLRLNSYWYKYLNRNPDNYDEFVKDIKEKYKLRTIDKIDGFVDTLDLITKIISVK